MFHALYCSQNVIPVIKSKKLIWDGECGTCGGEEKCIQVFWCGNLKEKEQLGRPKRRWEYNIRKYLEETGWEGVQWAILVQAGQKKCRAVVNTHRLSVPYAIPLLCY